MIHIYRKRRWREINHKRRIFGVDDFPHRSIPYLSKIHLGRRLRTGLQLNLRCVSCVCMLHLPLRSLGTTVESSRDLGCTFRSFRGIGFLCNTHTKEWCCTAPCQEREDRTPSRSTTVSSPLNNKTVEPKDLFDLRYERSDPSGT